MPVAKHWRLINLAPRDGGVLELSAAHLYWQSLDPDKDKVVSLLRFNDLASVVSDDAGLAWAKTGAAAAQTGAARFGAGGLQLDGASASLASQTRVNFGVGDFTFEAWVKLWETGSSRALFQLVNSNGRLSFYRQGASRAMGVYKDMGGEVFQVASQPTPVDQWFHVAFVRKDGVLNVYQDGVRLFASASFSLGLDDVALYIGQTGWNAEWFPAAIDEVRICKMARYWGESFAVPQAELPAVKSGNSVRVDQLAALSSSYEPLTGSTAALQAETHTQLVRFDAQAGLSLNWVFADDVQIDSTRFGAGLLEASFVHSPVLQHSHDGVVWTTLEERLGYQAVWPGPMSLSGISETVPAKTRGTRAQTNKVVLFDTAAFEASCAAAFTLDIEDGGSGALYGTVSRLVGAATSPLGRRVRLHEQRSGRLIRETWSDPLTGAYRFTDLKVGPEYCAIAFDHERQNFAVAADGQLAEEVRS